MRHQIINAISLPMIRSLQTKEKWGIIMTEYVKMRRMVIETKETDGLFKHLWETAPNLMESHGAETDYENDFGKVTHKFVNGKLIKL